MQDIADLLTDSLPLVVVILPAVVVLVAVLALALVL